MFLGKKKHIGILANKFNHSSEFEGNSLIFKSNLNFIRLTDTLKNSVMIHYNVTNGENVISVDEDDLIDVVYELLRRDKLEIITLKEGSLMSVEKYIEEVGQHYFDKKIGASKIHKNEILAGNRMEAEIYDNLLILTDDLRFFKTTTIAIG